jgi:protein-S-isoprenylcysteine O-methyltransferase Ste14
MARATARREPRYHDKLAAEAPRPRRDWWPLIANALLASLLALFAVQHFALWRETGRPAGLGLIIQETVTAVLLIIRRRARGTSRDPVAWAAMLLGSWGMLLTAVGIRLFGSAYDPVLGLGGLYSALQILGALCATISLGALGRSFGLVAANRGVQTGGPYRIVRHPAYASYLITNLGYILENPSLFNLAVLLLALCGQLIRIHKEEEFLAADPEYVAYRQRVRYRLVPLLY